MAAGDERLVDFIESGVAEGDEERGESAGPAPAGAAASNAAVEQHGEDKIFGEVGRLAYVVVDALELRGGHGGFEPVEDRLEEVGSVLVGEGVGGHGEDKGSPQQSEP